MALIYRGITIEDRKYEVILPRDEVVEQKWVDIFSWCYENFGDIDDGYWEWTGLNHSLHFYFFKEAHAMAFKLRWS